MPLTNASPAQIIRAHQKDSFYINIFRSNLYEICQNTFGSFAFIKYKNFLNDAAEVLYYGLTTISGLQTLGEEYVNVIQVNSDKRSLASTSQRIFIISLQIFGPFLVSKFLLHFEKTLKEEPLPQDDKKKLFLLHSFLHKFIPLFNKLHLAAFYFFGLYREFSKRLTRVEYVTLHPSLAQVEGSKPIFRILSGLVFAQSLYGLCTLINHMCQEIADGNLHVKEQSEIVKFQDADFEDGRHCLVPAMNKLSRGRCALCLDKRRNTTSSPCGHLFCWRCLIEWIRTSKTEKTICPVCRDQFHPSRIICLQNYI